MYYQPTDAAMIDRKLNPTRQLCMNRMLMGNGERMSYETLSKLHTPPATRTHVPVPHSVVVDMIRHLANENGLRILQEAHMTDHNHNRYFGIFHVAGGSEDIATILGTCNAHDKSIAQKLCAGNAPMVCSNLSFYNEFMTKAKHTLNVYTTVYERMSTLMKMAIDEFTQQQRRIEEMKNTYLSNAHGDSFIWDAVNAGVVTLKQGQRTRDQWRDPEHDDFSDRNSWSLQNAFTNVLRSERNRHTHLARTTQLTKLLDNEFKFKTTNIYA